MQKHDIYHFLIDRDDLILQKIKGVAALFQGSYVPLYVMPFIILLNLKIYHKMLEIRIKFNNLLSEEEKRNLIAASFITQFFSGLELERMTLNEAIKEGINRIEYEKYNKKSAIVKFKSYRNINYGVTEKKARNAILIFKS